MVLRPYSQCGSKKPPLVMLGGLCEELEIGPYHLLARVTPYLVLPFLQ